MGRDAGGHGHNPGEHGNDAHDKLGRFASGDGGGDSGGKGSVAASNTMHKLALDRQIKLEHKGKLGSASTDKQKWSKPHVTLDRAGTKAAKAAARGDHQNAQTHSGHGYPVTPHMGHRSVGTHASASSGGGGGGGRGSAHIKSGFGKHGHKRFGGGTGRLTNAAQERVALRQKADVGRYHNTGR